ncbi:aspartic proteinase 36 isoform X2 [Rhododendron vialii]|uniref:aspartic proteinase 36 isoform X2 n=1 Tax=Rhododendron vialii TaxID=182163 RepID=UPI00265DA9E9|nr:aspartic proteinase 36 isoform X2 [Rhododendron vialii]
MVDLILMRKRIGFEALAVGLCFFSYFLLGSANVVFNVKHKFEARERRSLAALKAHDDRRHGRSLAAVDLPLGGNGSPTDTALYYTEIGLGTPPKDYYLQVDTGSDIMWVNCAGCENCPKKSDLGVELRLYDPKGSTTGTLLTCDQDFCIETFNPTGCKVGAICPYQVTYGDGSSSLGYFVSDIVQLNRASGNLQTTPMNGSVAFGAHYNVILKTVKVGRDLLQISTDVLDSDAGASMVIDSGTTLAYLADELYNPLITKVMDSQPNLKLHTVEQQFTCFQFTENVDDGFPAVTFGFENSLSLTIYPREYLFQIRDDVWCVGWQNSGMSKDGKEMNLLGDMVLSSKLVLYDLENQTIGWTEYNCSSSVKVKDEQSGAEYLIGPHDLSSFCSRNTGWSVTLFFLLAILHNYM